MKATNTLPSAPLILKLVGTILILSSLIDYIALLLPPNFGDKTWFAGTVTQIVDRGIIPMVGLTFLGLGSFLESGSLGLRDRETPFTTLRFWAFLLSGLLSVIFLLAFPFHLNNSRQLSDQTLKDIKDRSEAAEQQLNAQVQQRRDQLQAALKDPNQVKQLDEQIKQLNDTVNSGQLKGDQLAQAQKALKELQALKSDPTNAITARAKEFSDKQLIDLRTNRDQAESQAKGAFWKTGVRVGISSLLLSLGYGLISLFGLREMGLGGRRKATLR